MSQTTKFITSKDDKKNTDNLKLKVSNQYLCGNNQHQSQYLKNNTQNQKMHYCWLKDHTV